MKLTDFVDLRAMANALRATFGMKKLDPVRPTKGVRWTRRAPGAGAVAAILAADNELGGVRRRWLSTRTSPTFRLAAITSRTACGVDVHGDPTCWYCKGEACARCFVGMNTKECNHDVVDRHGNESCRDVPRASASSTSTSEEADHG